jgi:hypothetical protein
MSMKRIGMEEEVDQNFHLYVEVHLKLNVLYVWIYSYDLVMLTNFHSKFAFTLDASTLSCIHVVEEEAKQEKGSRVRTPQGIQIVPEEIWKSREAPALFAYAEI